MLGVVAGCSPINPGFVCPTSLYDGCRGLRLIEEGFVPTANRSASVSFILSIRNARIGRGLLLCVFILSGHSAYNFLISKRAIVSDLFLLPLT